jgi:SAM-dependent methyltransferase
MPEDQNLAAMHAYYQRGEEEARLAGSACGLLEFERTREIVLRHLPPPPAVVADVGGGPGRYTHWLADLGYQVVHRDLMPLHVAQLQRARAAGVNVDSALADARDLDLADASVDAVLLLGPLYHLVERADRLRALTEARRVLRPGGVLLAAAISRFASLLDGLSVGIIGDPVAGGFADVAVLAVEGMARSADPAALDDPARLEATLRALRRVEREPALLGASPHLIAVANAPLGDPR